MKLYLYGHDYKYAAEQMLLTLFPAQRPEYPAGPPAPGEDALVLSLHRGAVWATATAALSYGGREYRAARRCRTAELTDPEKQIYQPVKTYITLGNSSDQYIEVTGGLTEGQLVIDNPPTNIDSILACIISQPA